MCFNDTEAIAFIEGLKKVGVLILRNLSKKILSYIFEFLHIYGYIGLLKLKGVKCFLNRKQSCSELH